MAQFNQQTFETVLRSNGLTEPRFLDIMRTDLAQKQLIDAVTAGAAAPPGLVNPLYEGQYQKRSADMVEFPLAAAPQPPTPTEAELHRWYDNHPDAYSAPEYRKIKAVVLSPESLSKEIPVTDEELHTAYDQSKADYVKPEKRSAEVISAPDEAKAKALAEQWQGGADWATMQKAAQAAAWFRDLAGRCDRGAVPRSGAGEERVRRHAERCSRAGERDAGLARGAREQRDGGQFA